MSISYPRECGTDRAALDWAELARLVEEIAERDRRHEAARAVWLKAGKPEHGETWKALNAPECNLWQSRDAAYAQLGRIIDARCDAAERSAP